jgi:ATP-dependent Clp protease ATP-binding subunit ClpA
MSFAVFLRRSFFSKGPTMTPRAALVVTRARADAVRLQQASTVQHLSLALLSLNEGCGMNVVGRWPIDIVALHRATLAQVESTPLDSVVEVARAEQQRFGHYYLGTEHLLLAVIQDGQNAFAQFLQQQGMDLTRARERVLKELDPSLEDREALP